MFRNLKKADKTCVFINGNTLYAATKSYSNARREEYAVDYEKLRNFFIGKCNLIRLNYYSVRGVYNDGVSDDFDCTRPLLDWLSYNGFNVFQKDCHFDEPGRKIKGNCCVDMSLDMIEIAENIDHAIIFAGDNDLTRATTMLQKKGVKVTVVACQQSSPSMIADSLRRAADNFVEIFEFFDLIPSSGVKGAGASDRYL